MSDDTIELRADDNPEIDLRDEAGLHDRLRFAAGSLAADFSGVLTPDLAEQLVFHSAEGLLATASVTDFVPILAERRARRVVRSSISAPPAAVAVAVPAAPSPDGPPVAAPTGPPAPGEAPTTGPRVPTPAPPLLVVPEETLARLRGGVEEARRRVAGWHADLTRRLGPS